MHDFIVHHQLLLLLVLDLVRVVEHVGSWGGDVRVCGWRSVFINTSAHAVEDDELVPTDAHADFRLIVVQLTDQSFFYLCRLLLSIQARAPPLVLCNQFDHAL